MKIAHACLLAALVIGFALPAAGQSSNTAAKVASSGGVVVSGLVTKDPGSEPVKKALIELIAENQSVGGNYTAVTAADGTFRIEGIVPGRYRLMAERTGFVEVERSQPRSDGRLLTLAAGQELKDVAIRLQATAAVDGRVTDEDGDPLSDAQVAVLRQMFAGGRIRWQQAGGERTNDLGEYRIAGLAAGRYYISVTPPPNFKSLIETASNAVPAEGGGQLGEQECLPHAAENCPSGKPLITSYMTTYYPGVKDRAQAASVQLRAGEDLPANFSLTPSPSVAIRGLVGNIPANASVTVVLRSTDFNSILNGGEVRKDGSFEIRDVSPGTYTLLAAVTGATPVPLMARQTLEVGAENLIGLRLILQAGGEIRGRLRVEGKSNGAKFDSHQLFLALRSADGNDDVTGALSLADGFSDVTQVAANGSFAWKNVPPGRYFLVLPAEGAASPDWFLKSAVVSSREVLDAGFSASGGALVLDAVASSNGAVVDGLVTNHKGEALSNATAVLVPEERFQSRTDRYRNTVTDQGGRFVLHGIPPGAYTLFAWESVEGEAYYNPEFLKSYEGQGRALRLVEGEHSSVQIDAVPLLKEQQ